MMCHSLIKIWNLANHMKKQTKKHQNAKSTGIKLKTKSKGLLGRQEYILTLRWKFFLSQNEGIITEKIKGKKG